MTRNFQQPSRMLFGSCVAAIVISGALLAQPPQGPVNPPALPATPVAPVTGTFGAIISAPGGVPSLPSPNTTTWTPIGPASLTEGGGNASGRITGIAVDPTNSSNIYISAAGGGVWQTTNGGSTWTALTDTQATLSMGAIAIAPSNHQHIYGGTGESNVSLDSNYGLGILHSTDGGATWALSTGPSGVFTSVRLTVSKISVHPTNENIAYAATSDYGENGLCCSNTGIYKTTDGGTTWVNVTSANSKDATRPWTDVVVDPNTPTTIYAAHGDAFNNDTANGVYRSLDSGTTWTLLTGAPSGGNTGRIALTVAASATTANQHVLYVAISVPLGNAGGGGLFEMLVSNNADATTPTFTNLTSTPNFGGSGLQGWYNWVIAASPTAAGTVYCAGALNYNTNADNIIVSTNANTSGASPTWTDITTVASVEPHTDSHALAFDSSSNLYLGNDGGIWKYSPGVPSWTNLNGNLSTIQFTGIGIHPTSTQTVIGGSQDNGTELTTGSTQWTSTDGGDGGFSQISQTNPLIVYSNHPIGSFGSTAFFRKSTDGGNNFTSITPTISNSSLFNFYAPIFVDPSNGQRVFLGGDGVYESSNAGGSWTKHTNPSANPINSIAVLPGGNVIYISTGGTLAGGVGQIWLSTNDGTSWTQHSLATTASVQEIDIDPNDSTGNTAVAVVNQFDGASGQVFRTVNSGTTWTNISGNLPVLPVWSAKIGTDTNKTIYVSTEAQVYSSPSPYSTWSILGSGLPNAQGVDLELNNSTHELALATHGRGAWFFSVTPTVASPTIAKAFAPSTIPTGGTSVVTLTLSNSNGSALTGAAFSDTLASMGTVAGAVGGTCVGTTPASFSAGQTLLSFTGITIPASSSCTVTFSVTSSNAGVNPNTTTGVTTTQTPTAGTVSNTANLTVLGKPTIGKTFTPNTIASGASSVVTLTLSNTNASALSGAAFSDSLVNMSAVGGSVTGTCVGTTPSTLSAGATALSFSGITIPATGSCTVIFSVTSTTVGSNPNTTSGVTTTQTPSAGSASNTPSLVVNAATSPTIAKAFSPTTIQKGGTSAVTLTLTNPNASALTGGAFTDTLSNMAAAGGSVTGTCVGTTPSTLAANATALSFSGITIPSSASCTVIFSVISNTVGAQPNVTSGVTTTQTTVGTASNTASLTVLGSPTIAKAFNPTSIVSGGSSVVTLTLSNANATTLTGASFSDTLSNMSAVAGSVTGTCTGTTPNTLSAGATALSFTGISIPNGSCTVIFSVTSSNVASNPNTTSGVTTTQTPTVGTASNTANLSVTAPNSPTIAKAFNPTSIVSGATSLVTLTLANSNASSLTGAAFSDTLVNMSATAGSVGGTCVGTSPSTLSAGATALSFSGITIPANSNCTVTFSVTSTNVAVNPNTTSGVTTTQTPTAGTGSNTANLTVTTAPVQPTVVSYSVLFGSTSYNLVGSARVHLPWDVAGIQVVFSQPITSANVNSLTGVSATGFSGLGTNTLTWTFTGITNSAGALATALATTGPNAIQSAGGNLTGSNTSFSIKILEGDFNDDGFVNASDLTLVNNARSQSYNIFADTNGDGLVNTTDVTIVRAQNGQSNP